MAKVLLVDTNFSSGPIHAELLAMGHEVHVTGNNPADCLAKMSKHYWQLDYSNTQALAELVDRQRYDSLVPGCTDRSYAACVAVSRGRHPGLDPEKAWHVVHNKGALRRALTALGIPTPRAVPEQSTHAAGAVIVKPVDAYSGKGATVVRSGDPGSLTAAVAVAKAASPSGEYIAEAFVEGQLYSHSAFIRKGRIVQDFFVREDGTANPFVVDTSHVLPVMDGTMAAKIRAAIELLAGTLSLSDGLLHTQFIADGTDFWLIELARRCPGDLYSQLIELSTGYPYARAYAAPFLGEELVSPRAAPPLQPIIRHTMTLDAPSDLAYVHFKRALHIERWVPLALVGDHIQPSPLSRVGILFCRATDHDALATLYRLFLTRDVYAIRDS